MWHLIKASSNIVKMTTAIKKEKKRGGEEGEGKTGGAGVSLKSSHKTRLDCINSSTM